MYAKKRDKHNALWQQMHSWCTQYRKDHRLTIRQFLRGIGLEDDYNLCRYLAPHYAKGDLPLSSKDFTAYALYRKLKMYFRNPNLLDKIAFDPPTLLDNACEFKYSGQLSDTRIYEWSAEDINGILHINVYANECGVQNITKEEALELFRKIGIKNLVIDEITYWSPL